MEDGSDVQSVAVAGFVPQCMRQEDCASTQTSQTCLPAQTAFVKFALLPSKSVFVHSMAVANHIVERRFLHLLLLPSSKSDALALVLNFCPGLVLHLVARAVLHKRIGFKNQDGQAKSMSHVVVFNLPPLMHGWHVSLRASNATAGFPA